MNIEKSVIFASQDIKLECAVAKNEGNNNVP